MPWDDLIARFLEIAERKISTLDDYGDENWAALACEIDTCIRKIAVREGDFSPGGRTVSDCLLCGRRFPGKQKKCPRCGGYVRVRNLLELPKYSALRAQLEVRFRDFHASKAQRAVSDDIDVERLTGEEFETHIARLLRACGYDVVGTPKTGDQGADLIAKRDGRTIAVQAKRYQKPVGNQAVQEVLGAVRYYSADEGWVVTSSGFTPSAKALAQKGGVKLFHVGELSAYLKP